MPTLRNVAVVAALTLALSASGGDNPYKQIENGVGNCIFSTNPLPARQEASYTNVKREFVEGETIYARCYFPKPLSEYAKVGTVANSMRDKGKRFAELWAWETLKSVNFPYVEAETGAWEQSSLNLVAPSNCHLGGGDGCFDYAGTARARGERKEEKFPYTVTYCVRYYAEAADATRTDLVDGGWVTGPAWYTVVMAKGCFDYTVK